MARAAMRAAKRQLDKTNEEYLQAVARFEALLQQRVDVWLVEQKSKTTVREPKGYVRDLTKLAFTSGGLGRARFIDVLERLESLAGRGLSPATVRQTLYRMEADGELERYSGHWSAGERLRSRL